ncbi:transporter [Brevibacillus sp. SYP-B805]|uniref:transporter n=1 Tax=Brevibacillus sp. SYP-B805 TaxID=1578199 RepID=UPI0013ECA6B8|nr:transporter [Brevibacillus sp. SYP-B805]NGQ94214.1 transporter [Brevibacillus sp. SYP-B805]
MAYNFPPGPPGGGNFPGPPPGPPPSTIPFRGFQQQRFSSFRPCLFRNTFVWLRNGNQFWFYPVFVVPGGASGYRWTGNRWRFYALEIRRVEHFACF